MRNKPPSSWNISNADNVQIYRPLRLGMTCELKPHSSDDVKRIEKQSRLIKLMPLCTKKTGLNWKPNWKGTNLSSRRCFGQFCYLCKLFAAAQISQRWGGDSPICLELGTAQRPRSLNSELVVEVVLALCRGAFLFDWMLGPVPCAFDSSSMR